MEQRIVRESIEYNQKKCRFSSMSYWNVKYVIYSLFLIWQGVLLTS